MDIHDTAVLGNGLDLQPGSPQKLLCPFHPSLGDEIGDGHARFFLENGGQVAAADIQCFCDGTQAQIAG